MQSIDRQFMEKADNDFQISGQQMTTEVASITTREIQNIVSPRDTFMQVDVPEAYRIDAKPYIERPFYVDSLVYPDTAARYSLLTPPKVKFCPGDVARSNSSLLNMFKMGAYGRPDLVLNISLAGTITHAGCILVGALPPMPSYPTTADARRLINSVLSGPHGFLYANEATSIALPVPWYSNTDMATLDMQNTDPYVSTLDITTTNGNYATIVYIVLNPLQPSAGSSKSLTIVVEACFKHFDIVVPTPRFVDWVSQSKQVAQAMKSPLYFDLAETEIHELSKDLKKIGKRKDLPKIIPIATAVLTVIGAVRTVIALIPDEVVGECGNFTPQSGIFKTLLSPVTGLADLAANGLKTVAGDAIDGARGMFKEWTGLHNPNVPSIAQRVLNTSLNFSNVVDVQQLFEKMDPNAANERIVKEPIFGTEMDEMQVSHIVAKKQYLGTFVVKDTDTVGKLLWVRPISPFQGGVTSANGRVLCANNIEMMHSLHRAWRGGLKLHVESVMNNKQQVKLKVLRFYNPSVQALTAYPEYTSIANAPSHLLEFTQGGQSHEIKMPYLCRNDLTMCSENMDVEGVFHGMYYIYVTQPLATSDGSPTSIEFNVYISGEPDLQFYGYVKSNTYHDDFNLFTSGKTKPEDRILGTSKPIEVGRNELINLSADKRFRFIPSRHDDKKGISFYEKARGKTEAVTHVLNTANIRENRERINAIAKAFKVPSSVILASSINLDGFHPAPGEMVYRLRLPPNLAAYFPDHVTEFKAQSKRVEVMNEPQQQTANLVRQANKETLEHETRLLPNVDIRPLIRRMYKTFVNEFQVNETSVNFIIPLASYLGETPNDWNYTPIETISRMYYGKTVGFKIRIALRIVDTEVSDAYTLRPYITRLWYVPQNVNINSPTRTVTAASIQSSAFTPAGTTSTIGEPPFTYQIEPILRTDRLVVYEFVVPDTSIYKFMGAPEKFKNFSSATPVTQLSTLDFGSYILQINPNGSSPLKLGLETFVGLTDETRFGHHSMAPPFTVAKKSASYYAGNNDTYDGDVPPDLNKYMYLGGYL